MAYEDSGWRRAREQDNGKQESSWAPPVHDDEVAQTVEEGQMFLKRMFMV